MNQENNWQLNGLGTLTGIEYIALKMLYIVKHPASLKTYLSDPTLPPLRGSLSAQIN